VSEDVKETTPKKESFFKKKRKFEGSILSAILISLSLFSFGAVTLYKVTNTSGPNRISFDVFEMANVICQNKGGIFAVYADLPNVVQCKERESKPFICVSKISKNEDMQFVDSPSDCEMLDNEVEVEVEEENIQEEAASKPKAKE
jgi:hypothetical protein